MRNSPGVPAWIVTVGRTSRMTVSKPESSDRFRILGRTTRS